MVSARGCSACLAISSLSVSLLTVSFSVPSAASFKAQLAAHSQSLVLGEVRASRHAVVAFGSGLLNVRGG